ncbi:MAG: FAD-dependent oxidoreductase, partial [Deltaproteobacteria bacterium]|nr:FAD-dependent oxidoreductase [Nannocystaceae bacterium]
GADSSSGSSSESGGEGMQRVAIIGGGMAGLHCAYRLREVGVDATVYESSDRTGGRMFTARDMFPGGQVAELGGEFIDSVHVTLIDLAEELGITLDDREASFDATTVRDTWWLDGAAVPDATVLAQFVPLAPLLDDLVAMADSDDDAYAMLDEIPLSQWLDDNVEGAELRAILGHAYRGEYGLELDEQSALNLIYLIGTETDAFRIFGISDERYHTHEGSGTFPDTLAAALDGHIQTNMALTAARDRDGGGFVLSFGEAEVEVEHLVFALPFTRLRAVDLAALTLSEEKRQIIAELGYGTNTKVMGAFASKPWRTLHDATGSVTSDLPMQQTWDTSVGQPGEGGLLTNFLGGEQGVAAGEGEAETWYTDVVVPGVEEVFPGAAAEYVADSAVRMHWPSYVHNLGSYACYRPGQWAFYGLEGAREGAVHFCGEHCSLEFQGFMEGAAETGMLTATAILDDLGIAMSRRHRAMAERKLVLPHPAVDGRLPERPRWSQRQRALVRRHARAVAR